MSFATLRAFALLAGSGAILGLLYAQLVRGAVTIDLKIGRRVRPLGPITVQIDAPRHLVFETISEPYLGRTPRALASKLKVIGRGEDFCLAEHYTPVHRMLTATTLETVRFSVPDRIDFRLVRGPVPYVIEHFILRERDGTTELEYGGEMGTDFWALGEAWAGLVAPAWERTVRSSLESVRVEAERRDNGGRG
ncbi:MAG: SRPBCC family protein [Chloroflexota bacterium]